MGANGIRHERDFYPTPPECTQALLNYLSDCGIWDQKAWECAAGDGAIVRVLEQNGWSVVGTDIASGTDFLTTDLPDGVEWIITNPPFNLAEAFIRRAVQHRVKFAFLLKSQYWHSKKRLPLFTEAPPSLILPLTWRPDFTGQGASLLDMMWCVWGMGTYHTEYIPLPKP